MRGGRFVNGFSGEQFALPEVLESLREAKNRDGHFSISIAGADPMNLVGVVLPGERTHALPGRAFAFSTQELQGHLQVQSRSRQRTRHSEHDLPSVTEPVQSRNQQVSLF